MSVRLTKTDREVMAKALVRHKFQDQAEALMQESIELFAAVYDERYDAQTQKLIRQLSNRHSGAFGATNSFYVNANGMRVHVGAQSIGDRYTVTWQVKTATRPVLYTCLHGSIATASTELANRIADFALRSKAFADEVGPAYSRAFKTLNQFTTGKKLSEDWPEAMPVIGNLIPASERNLPVVQLTAINDEFGLPPADAEAA